MEKKKPKLLTSVTPQLELHNMFAFHREVSSDSSSRFDETRWIINIRRMLEEELEDDTQLVPVCIFSVPKMLVSNNPEHYTPQQVALGPYHCWHPELYEMERYKLAAVKRTHKQLQNLKFQHLVEQLRKLEPTIRACYHNYLDFNGETLAWMMAIDASFLLEFLQIYAVKEGKTLSRFSSRMSHLVDYAGRKSGHNAILRDIVMLENQIPLFVMRKMLEFQLPTLESANDMLLSMLMGLCKELSPFRVMEEGLPTVKVSECAHVLDFLYKIIVPKVEEESEIIDLKECEEAAQDQEKASAKSSHFKQECEEAVQDQEKVSTKSSHFKRLLKKMSNLLSELGNSSILLFFRKVLSSKPVKIIVRLPWRIFSNLPGFVILKIAIEHSFPCGDKAETNAENASSCSNGNISKPPLVEEITIPSVTELLKIGFLFIPINTTVSGISFDVKTVEFYLPTISLDNDTEVILRNLVAYEASNTSGPLVFTRYTELMNGIIDTAEDVKLLRERGIILNRLKSDEEAADLWNGMSRSIRLTKVPFLDKVIEDVNKYYNSRWGVKVAVFLKQYVYSSWQFLTFLAAILLLLLLSLQAFWAVYSYSRVFRFKPAP